MSRPASSKPADPAMAAHVLACVDEARGIYELLFPTQRLQFVLSLGSDPLWARPEVIEGAYVPRPQDLGADYLGTVIRPGSRPDAPEVTVRLAIPRPPLPSELKQSDAPWRPIRRLGALFGASPLAYEGLRHQAEMLRKRREERRQTKVALPLGDGSDLIDRPAAPATQHRPAILIGMHWLEMGGAEKLGFDTVTWALAAGLRVFVVASVPAIQRLADRLPDHPDVAFIRLDRYLPHKLWPRYVAQLALTENIRAVHIHHCTPLYESLPMLRMHLPWLQAIDSTHIVEYANGGYPRISGVWSNFLDLQHVISRDLVDYLQGGFHTPPGQVVLGRMRDRDAGVASLPPLRFQPGQTTLHVSFVGRLYYQKRPVVVVEILRALAGWAQKNGVAFTATMVGDGPFDGTITRLLRRYGLTDTVAQMPGQADIPALLGRSDILLLPSNNEGLALVCYEAVAQGCIPISTRVGSQGELLPEDLLVPLAPRASVKATVAAVDRMWRDADVLARHKAGLQEAWTRLSADPTAEEILMPVYRRIAQGDAA
ncbi:glycosyltransferase family 4 protein [Paracoccus gahaiensis]|uniref:Glycosyltransferase family 4 protein n=1 Tax=Paracoccus gahaiensis TaxID=1706839 RepID=A0A4U0RDD3_9RHOB|nr:glycosyltransferase [Paracoccus gahaiensis]TJZ93245.1 glycosyltransferase family 4 protein [Paracoccus gahaiensis]